MQLWRDFWRNIRSGLRVALGLAGLAARIFASACGNCSWCSVFNVAIGACVDYVRAGPDPVLSTYAIVYEGFMGAVLLLMGALLSAAFRQPHLRLAVPRHRARQRAGAERVVAHPHVARRAGCPASVIRSS